MRKKTYALLLLAFTLPASAFAQTCDTARADMNCDGILDNRDVVIEALLIYNIAPQGCRLLDPNGGDLNCDGFKDAADLAALFNCVGGFDPSICPPPDVRPTLPDPRDSIIIESRAAVSSAGACSSAVLKVRVFITNKDTLANVTLPLEERSVSGGAYAILSRPASCSANRTTRSVFDFLYPLNSYDDYRLGYQVSTFQHYNSQSPDSFLFSGTATTYNGIDFELNLLPNVVRTPLLDIRFDTAFSTDCNAIFEMDSTMMPLANTIQFVDWQGLQVPVNFVKGVITVNPKADLNADGELSPSDAVLVLKCVFSEPNGCNPVCRADVDCDGALAPSDVVLELNRIFLGSTEPPWCGT